MGAPRLVLVAGAVAAFCVAYMSFYAVVPIPQNSDLYPALPIARESASPGLYSTQDLTVMSGLRGPFHVYRIIGGALYARGANVDLVWHGLFLAFLLLTFVTLWLLAWEVGRNAMAASIVTALIAAMHPFRGSLNWSWVPLSGFVSAMAAMPFALLAFVLLLRRRHNWALWLASATFIIHPYIGLIAVFACSGVTLFDARGVPGRVRAAWFAVAALIALPNAVTILVNLPQNFAGNIGGELYGQFRVHMYHAFVEDHWREGYGWFFLALAATTFFAPQLRRAVRRPVTIIIIALLTLAALYLFNLYVVRYYALMLTLLFRVTYFLKPLMAAVIVVGAWRWLPALRAQAAVDLPLTALLQRVAARRSGRIRFAPVEGYLALALLSLSAVIPPVPVAEALALLACALLLLTTGRARGLAAGLVGVGAVELLFAVAPRSAPALTPPDAWWDIAVGINVMAGLALAVVFWRMPPPIQVERAGAHTIPGIWRNLATAGAVCMASVMVAYLWTRAPALLRPRPVTDIAASVYFSTPDPSIAGMTAWARRETPAGALFVIPPNDERFARFRLAAERGVFIMLTDINQLVFDAPAFAEGQARLNLIGVRTLDRHSFDSSGYYNLSGATLRRLGEEFGARYIVFDADRVPAAAAGLPEAYRDETLVALELHGAEDGDS